MTYKLKFEEEVHSEIEPIPFAAQYRLDNVGVKFGPETWNNLSNEARLLFCHLSLKTVKEKEYYKNLRPLSVEAQKKAGVSVGRRRSE